MWKGYGGTIMTRPSTLVSLRITDEEMSLLDARVGLDGARNRSDVIRAAIRLFLEGQPLLPDMGTITIPVGRSMKSMLGDLYELQGISPDQAASQGLQDYVRRLIQEEATMNEILAEGLVEARSKTVGRKEFTE
ncbi:MAG: ribbon-helix-helix domain-containing protein [Candidatus Poseidoniales archaeon]